MIYDNTAGDNYNLTAHKNYDIIHTETNILHLRRGFDGLLSSCGICRRSYNPKNH